MAAIPLLESSRVKHDRIALQRHFKKKRDHVLTRLEEMGLKVEHPPTSTFYIWLSLKQLPSPLNSGLVFFEELLKEKVIVVPGPSLVLLALEVAEVVCGRDLLRYQSVSQTQPHRFALRTLC
jgi:aspartate/methionine/tyrosine aminotransferase